MAPLHSASARPQEFPDRALLACKGKGQDRARHRLAPHIRQACFLPAGLPQAAGAQAGFCGAAFGKRSKICGNHIPGRRPVFAGFCQSVSRAEAWPSSSAVLPWLRQWIWGHASPRAAISSSISRIISALMAIVSASPARREKGCEVFRLFQVNPDFLSGRNLGRNHINGKKPGCQGSGVLKCRPRLPCPGQGLQGGGSRREANVPGPCPGPQARPGPWQPYNPGALKAEWGAMRCPEEVRPRQPRHCPEGRPLQETARTSGLFLLTVWTIFWAIGLIRSLRVLRSRSSAQPLDGKPAFVFAGIAGFAPDASLCGWPAQDFTRMEDVSCRRPSSFSQTLSTRPP